MDYKEKREVIYELLKLLKAKKLNKSQKRIVYDIVMSLSKKTMNQKERFIKLYNLDPNITKQYTLTTLAKESNRSTNAIRMSVVSIKATLTRISDVEIMILKKITEEYK